MKKVPPKYYLNQRAPLVKQTSPNPVITSDRNRDQDDHNMHKSNTSLNIKNYASVVSTNHRPRINKREKKKKVSYYTTKKKSMMKTPERFQGTTGQHKNSKLEQPK